MTPIGQPTPVSRRESAGNDDPAPHRGLLRGPSQGLCEWTRFFQGVAEWMIGARQRWHEVKPPQRTRPTQFFLGGAALVAVTTITERLLGG